MSEKVFILSIDGKIKILAKKSYVNGVSVYVILKDKSTEHIGKYIISPFNSSEYQFYEVNNKTAINEFCVSASYLLKVIKIPCINDCCSIHGKSQWMKLVKEFENNSIKE